MSAPDVQLLAARVDELEREVAALNQRLRDAAHTMERVLARMEAVLDGRRP